MADTPDLNRVISLIMQNPKLVEEISEMARGDAATPSETEVVEAPTEASVPREDAELAAAPVIPVAGGGRRRDQRVKLLGAMKAYLSPERAKAVDTMMNILDILELTGGRG